MDKVCEQCGKSFDTARPNAKYCGNTCKMAAYRHRRRSGRVQSSMALLEKLRPLLPETARKADDMVKAYGWDCAAAAVKLALTASKETESRRSKGA
jgi:hypothetical protein